MIKQCKNGKEMLYLNIININNIEIWNKNLFQTWKIILKYKKNKIKSKIKSQEKLFFKM